MKKYLKQAAIYSMCFSFLIPTAAGAAGASNPVAGEAPPQLTTVCAVDPGDTSLGYSVEDGQQVSAITLNCDAAKIDISTVQVISTNSSIVEVTPRADNKSIYLTKAISEGHAEIVIQAQGFSAYSIPVTVSTTDIGSVASSEQEQDMSTGLTTEQMALVDALTDYSQTILGIADLENEAINTYTKYRLVTDKNRKQAYVAFNTVIVPKYSKFVWQMKQIKPTHPRILKVHNDYLAFSKLRLEAFTLMKQALYSQKIKADLFYKANEILKKVNTIQLNMQKEYQSIVDEAQGYLDQM